MGIRFPSILAKQILRRSATNLDVPKGFLAVYVGLKTQRKRFVVPLFYLNEPLFQDLLTKAEEEFGFHPPMGCLTIPCDVGSFIEATSLLCRS